MSRCDAEACEFWAGFGCVCNAHGLRDMRDPYDRPVFVQGHQHSEPVCAWPDCETYLTRDEMAALLDEGSAS